MQQLYQDSMAIVWYFERPSLFITFTANSNLVEIERELLEGQTVVDRAGLVAHVFKIKKNHLTNEISHNHISEPFLARVWTIEYQKHRLSHLHYLVFLQTDAQFLTAETINNIVCAELPNKSTEQGRELGRIIKSSMVHTFYAGGNLNAACMTKRDAGQVPICNKRYPRPFQTETVLEENGYPLYQWRDTGQFFIIPVYNAGPGVTARIDNPRMVPYNPFLCLQYKAHINVEICGSIRAVKYIHKYIYRCKETVVLDWLIREGLVVDSVYYFWRVCD